MLVCWWCSGWVDLSLSVAGGAWSVGEGVAAGQAGCTVCGVVGCRRLVGAGVLGDGGEVSGVTLVRWCGPQGGQVLWAGTVGRTLCVGSAR